MEIYQSNKTTDIKSFATNLIALLFIIVGYQFNFPLNKLIFDAGLFAFSGAITNWLAIHMLFEKVPFLYGSGIIPNKFEEFKKGIKTLILKQFFNSNYLNKLVKENSLLTDKIDFENIYQQLLNAIVESPLGGMLNMFGGKEALEPMKGPIIEKLKNIVSDIGSNADLSSNLEENIEFIVDRRLEELTPEMVKTIIQEMIRQHLGWLVVWGGVFGGLIGIAGNLLKLQS